MSSTIVTTIYLLRSLHIVLHFRHKPPETTISIHNPTPSAISSQFRHYLMRVMWTGSHDHWDSQATVAYGIKQN
jgi:hypothetical protein